MGVPRQFGPLFFCIAGLVLLATGCGGGLPPVDDPVDDEVGAVGIYLEMKPGALALTKEKPEMILFVRLDEPGDLATLTDKRSLIPSSYADGGHVYLLNVPPGTYVAVAALYGEDVEPIDVPVASHQAGDVGITFSLSLFGGEVITRNYFSMGLIEQTLTTVEPGEFAFMGRFSTNQSFRFGDGDPAQTHFLKIIEGENVDRSGFISDMLSSDWAKRLDTRDTKKSKKDEISFCKKAKQNLKGTGWETIIDRQMVSN